MAIRAFFIHYATTDEIDYQSVDVQDGETPAEAITREGDAQYEFTVYEEITN